MRSPSSTWTLLVALSVAGCTTGVRGSRRPRTSDPVAGAACPPAARAPVKPSEPAFVPGRIEGTPSIRVEWEALSVEQEQLANSRFHTTGLDTFGAPDLEVVLLNASFEATPDQDRENRGQIAVGRVARVPDQDMLDLIKNLDRLGFFKYAQPTASVRAFFASDRARGRITVDRDGAERHAGLAARARPPGRDQGDPGDLRAGEVRDPDAQEPFAVDVRQVGEGRPPAPEERVVGERSAERDRRDGGLGAVTQGVPGPRPGGLPGAGHVPRPATVPYAVIVPARIGSTRLPEKPLLRETGKLLVQHVVERALRAPGVARVVVATDDDRIEAAVRAFGGEVVRTDPAHESGTSRCAEVAAGLAEAVVVNVQGDEPAFEPADLARLAEAAARPGTDVATLSFPVQSADEAARPSVVKVVVRADGAALYFSRAPIPFDRAQGRAADGALAHVGIYAFRRARLLDYVRLPAGRLAAIESLEQLRALEAGWRIQVLPAARPALGIDTPEDYRRFVELVRTGGLDRA